MQKTSGKERTYMFLKKFEKFNSICIQCHDSPDADALGAGYGLYAFFKSQGKDVSFIYTGENKITKPSLLLMVEKLQLPITYVTSPPAHEILIVVDCQYRGGNITPLETPHVAMVDHHPMCVAVDSWCHILPEYGSCCTVVWELLQDAGFAVNDDVRVATALYYGLYSDTGELSEIYHPMDKEMRDSLRIDREQVEQMIHANLLRKELQIAGEALTDYYYDEELRFALLHTKPCDPNLLGVISDLVSHVATIDYCVVYNETPIGYKLSVRSAQKTLSANALVGYISNGLGSGGGHTNKAGGMLMKQMLAGQYPDEDVEQILRRRIKECITEASC